MQGETFGLKREQPKGTLELVEDEAVILVKAAPRRSQTHGETVCCAGIDNDGRWVRLYPVSFRELEDAQRFNRWSKIRFRWSKPRATKDTRIESRRVDHKSIEICGELRKDDRNKLLNRCAVTSLDKERLAGRSLALLKMEVLDFWYQKLSDEEIAKRENVLSLLRAQSDMFAPAAQLIAKRTCPYEFHYKFRDDDGIREGTCQDWETQQTFFRRLKDQGSEKAALDWVEEKFGNEYPKKGMALAMGTHSRRSEQWLINGVIRLNPDPQLSLL